MYNDWFSEKFGFRVVLAYWGGNARQVLGNLSPSTSTLTKESHDPISGPQTAFETIVGYIPIISRLLAPNTEKIAFNDCASFLVITEESSASVSTRLPENTEMDITKFRANIILAGSPAPFDEDLWGELLLGNDIKIALTANCTRCVSLNVDYATGKPGMGVLKLLMKDRRVDEGVKWSPVFGRYGFLLDGKKGGRKELEVGSEVVVSKRLERTSTLCECEQYRDMA